ncbi:hypothetical protein D910_10107 [Dendroctonus ponderosae]|uniref:Uncharacterized protein n=1 Tax=Dendroctonus ponderosae TaxID=77166 RepID=U4UFN9_DENPD|nr:hypothetical protein D910_10107 [Dendroctonus ponderosae]
MAAAQYTLSRTLPISVSVDSTGNRPSVIWKTLEQDLERRGKARRGQNEESGIRSTERLNSAVFPGLWRGKTAVCYMWLSDQAAEHRLQSAVALARCEIRDWQRAAIGNSD